MAAKKTTRKETPITELPGYEFLIPIEELPVLTQFEAVAVQETAFKEDSGLTAGEQFKVVYEFMRDHLAKDREGLEKWATGRGAITRVIELGLTYIDELGKDEA